MVFNELLQNADLSVIIPYSIAFIVLLIASYTDIKTREVPDWLNFGLIGAGFGINLLFSIIYWDFRFIVNSLVGFSVFFIVTGCKQHHYCCYQQYTNDVWNIFTQVYLNCLSNWSKSLRTTL